MNEADDEAEGRLSRVARRLADPPSPEEEEDAEAVLVGDGGHAQDATPGPLKPWAAARPEEQGPLPRDTSASGFPPI